MIELVGVEIVGRDLDSEKMRLVVGVCGLEGWPAATRFTLILAQEGIPGFPGECVRTTYVATEIAPLEILEELEETPEDDRALTVQKHISTLEIRTHSSSWECEVLTRRDGWPEDWLRKAPEMSASV